MDELNQTRTPPPVPARPPDAHKGTFGTVIVVGGCPTMPGAAGLCATGALRGGAGLVKIATEPGVMAVALGVQPCATGVLFSSDVDACVEALDRADPDGGAVLAVGPGMGASAATGCLVGRLLAGPRAVVLDADGLHGLAQAGRARPETSGPALVLTPHPGEYRRLAEPLGIGVSPTDPKQRPRAAAELARAHHAVVVLKGACTVVSDGRGVYVNNTGNPAMATAGSGDVLTGLIAALLAQRMGPFEAAVLGVFLHGLAGDLWAQRHGLSGLTAQDLAMHLPDAFEDRRGRERGPASLS